MITKHHRQKINIDGLSGLLQRYEGYWRICITGRRFSKEFTHYKIERYGNKWRLSKSPSFMAREYTIAYCKTMKDCVEYAIKDKTAMCDIPF